MKLTHYTDNFFQLELKEYRQAPNAKPRGLWIDVPNYHWACGWREMNYVWNFRDTSIAYDVVLKPNSKVLVISDPLELTIFEDKYKEIHKTVEGETVIWINWKAVAEEYHGIIITPHCYNGGRTHYYWYSTWDVSSGCIWNTEALESFEIDESLIKFHIYTLKDVLELGKIYIKLLRFETNLNNKDYFYPMYDPKVKDLVWRLQDDCLKQRIKLTSK